MSTQNPENTLYKLRGGESFQYILRSQNTALQEHTCLKIESNVTSVNHIPISHKMAFVHMLEWALALKINQHVYHLLLLSPIETKPPTWEMLEWKRLRNLEVSVPLSTHGTRRELTAADFALRNRSPHPSLLLQIFNRRVVLRQLLYFYLPSSFNFLPVHLNESSIPPYGRPDSFYWITLNQNFGLLLHQLTSNAEDFEQDELAG